MIIIIIIGYVTLRLCLIAGALGPDTPSPGNTLKEYLPLKLTLHLLRP